ncbi:hypothetical protein DFS34DRAFT_647851 [Phlyctochytrium arcticum]|nr:hypothetical protein DFS34DRAFT_647851 [Phlyctochytrium arcticum]
MSNNATTPDLTANGPAAQAVAIAGRIGAEAESGGITHEGGNCCPPGPGSAPAPQYSGGLDRPAPSAPEKPAGHNPADPALGSGTAGAAPNPRKRPVDPAHADRFWASVDQERFTLQAAAGEEGPADAGGGGTQPAKRPMFEFRPMGLDSRIHPIAPLRGQRAAAANIFTLHKREWAQSVHQSCTDRKLPALAYCKTMAWSTASELTAPVKDYHDWVDFLEVQANDYILGTIAADPAPNDDDLSIPKLRHANQLDRRASGGPRGPCFPWNSDSGCSAGSHCNTKLNPPASVGSEHFPTNVTAPR